MNELSTASSPEHAITSATTRRAFIGTAAVAVAVGAGSVRAQSGTPEASQRADSGKALAQLHAARPFKFDSSRLRGLSKALIDSHWSNNYGGAVRTLNAVKAKLAIACADSSIPPFVYAGLKREHLLRSGSVVMHDLYFENLGGGGHADASVRT